MKHERAFMVSLAYIIGFTTAFIGYGLATDVAFVSPVTVVPQASQVAAVAAMPSATVAATPAIEGSTTDLTMERDGEVRLISVTKKSAPELGDVAHATVYAATPSPDADYLFYCMSSDMDAASCLPYVYSWEENAIHPLTIEGDRVTFAPDALLVRWDDNESLAVNGWTAADAPWRLE